MFTGLVEETGKVARIEQSGEGKRICLETKKVFRDASVGDSISVSGACLTVEEVVSDQRIRIFLAEETLEKTWFSRLDKDDELNLERSLTPQDRMGGHFVQGHVDRSAKILGIEELEEGWNFSIELPQGIRPYVVEKGFIAVEGISLTVTEVGEDSFSVTIIPETWKVTNLSEKSEGDYVNLEVDMLAKYVEKMVDKRDA